MSPLRALAWLTASLVARALREGLVVRALSWPGLLTALTLVVSAGGVGLFYASDSMAVAEPALAEELRSRGLNVVLVEDPEAAFHAGEVDRAAWLDGDTWQLHTRFGGRLSLLAEGALRERPSGRCRCPSGCTLPLASLGALAKGVAPSPAVWGLTLLFTALVCWRAGRTR